MASVSNLEEERARTADSQIRQQLQELIDKRTKERKARRENLFGFSKTPKDLALTWIIGIIIVGTIIGIGLLSTYL